MPPLDWGLFDEIICSTYIRREIIFMAKTDVPTPFKVAKIHPQMVSRGKKGASLFRTDILGATVQVVTEGGETNLHAHAGSDATWLVIAGQATFYGEGDKVVARLENNEMVLVPRGEP